VFTGIVRHVGRILQVRPAGPGRVLRIELGPLAADLRAGDSVAVNGTCLTARDPAGGAAEFDVVATTLEKTTAGELAAGGKVNLEPALRVGQGLDGHMVQGHVDGVARVREVRREPRAWQVIFAADEYLIEQMVPAGSVAVDGVSLTIASLEREGFSVSLIPTTLGETTLAELSAGRRVNIETDVLGKYVRRHLQRLSGGGGSTGGLSIEKLKEWGFA
jgi:riboflavin synthase